MVLLRPVLLLRDLLRLPLHVRGAIRAATLQRLQAVKRVVSDLPAHADVLPAE